MNRRSSIQHSQYGSRGRAYIVALTPILLLVAMIVPEHSVLAQDDAEYFRMNCMSCHTIGGGRLTGPDLKDVHTRRDRKWLVDFMMNPQAMIASGDPTATQLLSEARGVVMPGIPTLTRARAEQLLQLIEKESALEASAFKGAQVVNRPTTSADIEMGRKLFTGERTLANGGPSCISCHAVQGLGGLGGGNLAPDLTTVFERYESRTVLSSWLSAPATPTMQSLFRTQALSPDEVLALVAYFEHALTRNPADPSAARLNFLLLGLGGTLLLLGLFDVLWNKRFRSVRRALVDRMRNNKAPVSGNGVDSHE